MNKIDLNNRVAVITGGAKGLGLATAQRFLDSGAKVALWDIDADRLAQTEKKLATQYGADHVLTNSFDLAKEEEVVASTQKVMARYGQIDILVNNAGITGGNDVTWKLKSDVWAQVLAVNLFAPYLVCRSIIPEMLKNNYGRIVNVASIAGKEGNPTASHYSASKAGLIALTKSLGKELASSGVIVNAITPAAARTEIFDQMAQEHIDYMLSKIPMNRFLEPNEVAAMIAWLSSQECSFTTGAVIDISGGRATY